MSEILNLPSCSGIVFWTDSSTEPLDPELLSVKLPNVRLDYVILMCN